MINKFIIVGKVGRKPELKKTGNVEYCQLSLNTKYRKKSKDGSYDYVWDKHYIVFFDKTAQNICQYVGVDDVIGAEGVISYKEYEGRKQASLMGDRFYFCGDGKGKKSEVKADPKKPF